MQKEKFNHSLKLLAKSSIFVFFSILLSKILAYLYKIIIARKFGAEGYGIFSLSTMIFSIITIIFSLGISEGIVRYISFYRGKKENSKINYIFKKSSILILSSSIIGALIMFFLSEYISINIFHNPQLIIFLKFLSFFVPISVASGIFTSTIRAFEEIKWSSFIKNILGNAIQLITLIILVYLGFKTNSIIFSYTLGIVGIFIVSYFICKIKIFKFFKKEKISKEVQRKTSHSLYSYSWPLMFLTIISMVLYWIDSFAIGYFRGASEVGIYNVATSIALLFNILPQIFIQLFFPLITREFANKNIILIKRLSKQLGKWIFILNFPLLVLLILFPGEIINILFGSEFILAKTSLIILSIGIFISSIFKISTYLILTKEKSKIVFMNLLIVSIINLLLNLTLVPKYGITGAAFSTMISQILISTFLLFETKFYFSIVPLKKEIFKILLGSLVPIFILLSIKKYFPLNWISFILQAIFFFLAYFLLALLFKGLDKSDLMILNLFKSKIKDIIS